MPIYPRQVGYIKQQIKQRVQEQNTCILLYMLYYSSRIYHEYIEITTKSFARSTVIILCRL